MEDVEATGAVNPGEATQPEETQNAASEGKTFTQDEFNSKLAEVRAKMERKLTKDQSVVAQNATTELLGKLGIDDVDSFLQSREEKLTAEDKLASLHSKFQKVTSAHDKAIAELSDIKAKQKDFSMKEAVEVHAQKAGCQDTDLLFTFLKSKNHLSCSGEGIVYVVDSNGDPSDISLEQLINKTLDEKPYLKAATPSTGAGSRPSQGTAANGKPDLLTKEGRMAKLLELGVLSDS